MNEKHHIEIIENRDDIKSALDLSLKSFYPESIPGNAKKIWENKWFNEPYSGLSNIFVNRSKNKIIGGLRTVHRTIYRDGQEFNVLGIAETFVNPSCQKRGIAGALTGVVLDKNKNGNADLAFIVSRRNLDRFYLKYKGYGLGSYCKVIIKIMSNPKIKYSIRELNKNDLEVLMRIYNYSYENCFGRVKRNAKYWNYLINSAKFQNIKYFILEDKNEIVSYFVFVGNEIIEIGAIPYSDYRLILTYIYDQFKDAFENESIIINVPNNHKLFYNDIQLDVTVSNRECYYGGHVVKILNMKSVVLIAKKRLKKEYLRLNIPSLKFNVDELNIEWDKKYLDITYQEDHAPSYNETAFLLGSQQVYSNPGHISNIGRLPFSISRLDEF